MRRPELAKNIRLLELILKSVMFVLCIFSIIALIAIHWKMCSEPMFHFSFSAERISTYFGIYSEHEDLFRSTVLTIAGFLGLQRLKVANDANSDKLKQDMFMEWRTVQEVRLIEIEKEDPLMKREFIKLRQNLFMELYDLNFEIKDKDQLSKIFTAHFKDRISFFESMNTKSIAFGSIYRDREFSFASQNFAFMFNGCIEKGYDLLYSDILELYRTNLPSDRLIDPGMYDSALRNYLQSKK